MINFTETIKEAYSLIKTNFKKLVPYLVALFLVYLISDFLTYNKNEDVFSYIKAFFVMTIGMITSIMSLVIYYYILFNKDFSLKKAFLNTYRFFPRVFIAGIISTFVIFAGFILFIIPGFIALAGLSVVVPIILFEKGKVIESIKESMNRTKGHRINIFYFYFIFIIINIIISVLIPNPVASVLSLLVDVFIQMILFVFINTITFIIYKKLKHKNSNTV